MLGEDILLEFDGAGALLARTSHGQGTDQPLAVERGGQSFYYHADHQGSIRKITDSAGLVVNSYDYDSYGNIEASFEGIANPFTYTGRELDAESGLYFYRARYYDPATGRFLSEDPIGFAGGDPNLYSYVFNNPINLTDPDGENPFVYAIIRFIVKNFRKIFPRKKPPKRPDDGPPQPPPLPPPLPPEPPLPDPDPDEPKDSCDDPGDNEDDPDGPGDGDDGDEDDDGCELQAQADEAVCRSLSSPAVRARCFESANARFGACRAGKPLPPLITK